jgi:hypothetical protein
MHGAYNVILVTSLYDVLHTYQFIQRLHTYISRTNKMEGKGVQETERDLLH